MRLNSRRYLKILKLLAIVLSPPLAVLAIIVSILSRCDADSSARAANRSAAVAESSYVRSARAFNLEHRPDVLVYLGEDRLSMAPRWDSLQFRLMTWNQGPGLAESIRISIRIAGRGDSSSQALVRLEPDGHESVALPKLDRKSVV